jgi:hypothetical protein
VAADYWNIFRSLTEQMAHEDDLLASRTLWLILSQCLLVVAYFVSYRSKTSGSLNGPHPGIVGLLGILSAAFIYAAILASEWEFIQLRSMTAAILASHPDLPMRPLPTVGIGAGLLGPILLSLLFLTGWVLLTVANRSAALFCFLSGALFAIFVLGEAHEPSQTAAIAIGISGAVALLTLALALMFAVRSGSAAAERE